MVKKWNWLMHHSSAEKNHLLEIYNILYLIGNNDVVRYSGLQCLYGPGSIASTSTEPMVSEGSLVVGKIPVGPIEWAVGWKDNNDSVWSPMCSKSFTIHYLPVFQEHYIVISPQTLQTPEYYTQSQQMMYSLFAQASWLSLSSSQNLRDIDHRVHNTKYAAVCKYVDFCLKITPCYNPFQLLDTFMADSEYSFALSLTICEPHLNSQSNITSWPVIHWFCDLDLSNEISVKEVEALFGIEVEMHAVICQHRIPKKALSTIVEINTMCGFDSALEGADICKYFDLPCMEIFENPFDEFTREYQSGGMVLAGL
ncbi:hypothetical protein ARMGADRAFT_669972 [Armillaria gallica]|uniref:Uncharacterized protein n=1 Tax=Armillaria gallica TaxID=47427 RepID=A0A2H3D7H8_ARMGA|nr:hypothetical protein ARMGADRAFT_669972 [Armillaria gallica]